MADTRDLGFAVGELLSSILRRSSIGDESQYEALREGEALRRRRDPKRVPGSRHFASMLAYGHFIITDGPTIVCDAIPGISGVQTLPKIEASQGRPVAKLKRILTHFHFDDPEITIEQSPYRDSTGELVGSNGELLPGRASFDQYLILTLNNRPLANREALVMTADRVDQWPPVGATFVLEKPTAFYDLREVNDLNATPFATLAACKGVVASELDVPLR